MKRLWAPWRLAYLKDDTRDKKHAKCPFCELPKKPPSEKTLVLWRDDDIFVVMNKFPYNPSHLMVIPRQHTGDPSELSPEVWRKLSLGVRASIEILKQQTAPQGFNVGMNLGRAAGAGIPKHLHWHVLPRWDGDTNFLPLIAETKNIAAHNETIYRQLKPLFTGFEKRLGAAKMKGK